MCVLCSVPNTQSKPQGIVCSSCNTPGHKSPDCPNKNKFAPNSKSENKGDNKQIVVKRGSRTYNTSWIAAQEGASHVDGMVDGLPCQIVPDTGAEITVVPASLVYENQLIDEHVKVRNWNGDTMVLQTARVDFEFAGNSFLSVVAVAHEDDLCHRVLFSIPMDGYMAARLLLDATSNAPNRAGGVGHPDVTSGIQTSAKADDGSAVILHEACKTSQGSDSIQRSATVSAVTRSVSKANMSDKSKGCAQSDVDSNLNPFQFALESVARNKNGIEKCAAEADDSVASVSVMDPSGSGLGVFSENNMDDEMSGHIALVNDVVDVSVVVDTQPVDLSGGNSKSSDDVVDLCVPQCVDVSNTVSLISEIMNDESLAAVRDLAKRNMNDYLYNDQSILIHSVVDELNFLLETAGIGACP